MTCHISGKVNQPIVLVWGTENPHVTLEDDRDAQNCVLCSFKGKAYGSPPPPFLRAGAGNTITANSYLDMLTWPLPQSSYKMECFLPSIWFFRTT